MKNILSFFSISLFTILLVISCKSFDDITINALDEQSQELYYACESLIVEYSFTKEKSLVGTIKQQLESLDNLAAGNVYFEAKVFGLSSYFYFSSGNTARMKEALNEIELRNKKEEFYQLVSILQEQSNSRAISELKKHIQKNSANEIDRLQLFLAVKLLAAGKFSESVALFDKSFPRLPLAYSNWYQDTRDIAWKLSSNPPNDFSNIDIIIKDRLSFADFIQLLNSETRVFSRMDLPDSNLEIFNTLINDGFFYKPVTYNTTPLTIIKRKDFAFFVVNLIAKLEKDKNLPVKYAPKKRTFEIGPATEEDDDESYLPDVKTGDFFYSAALVLIEREIMDLPDGENFYPDNEISGLTTYNVCEQLNRFYNK
jgi:hypothetical protein